MLSMGLWMRREERLDTHGTMTQSLWMCHQDVEELLRSLLLSIGLGCDLFPLGLGQRDCIKLSQHFGIHEEQCRRGTIEAHERSETRSAGTRLEGLAGIQTVLHAHGDLDTLRRDRDFHLASILLRAAAFAVVRTTPRRLVSSLWRVVAEHEAISAVQIVQQDEGIAPCEGARGAQQSMRMQHAEQISVDEASVVEVERQLMLCGLLCMW